MKRNVIVLLFALAVIAPAAMAQYVTPTTRATGFVVTAARWNQDVVANMIATHDDPEILALLGLVSAADQLPYFTGSGTAALATFTSFGRSLVDDSTAAAARVTLVLPQSSMSGGYVTRSGTNLLYAPDKSNRVWCYESSVWTDKTIADAGITVACTGLTVSTDYYLYVYDSDANGTADALDLSTTVPTTQNGISVKTGATSRTLIARCRTDSAGAILTAAQDASQQLVNNVYNKRHIFLFKGDSTSSWTYTTNTFRSANNSTANRVQFVSDGVSHVSCSVFTVAGNASAVFFTVGIDLDGTTTNDAQMFIPGVGNSSGLDGTQAFYSGAPSAGFHYLQWIEKSTATGTCTWYGTNSAGALAFQTGITLDGEF